MASIRSLILSRRSVWYWLAAFCASSCCWLILRVPHGSCRDRPDRALQQMGFAGNPRRRRRTELNPLPLQQFFLTQDRTILRCPRVLLRLIRSPHGDGGCALSGNFDVAKNEADIEELLKPVHPDDLEGFGQPSRRRSIRSIRSVPRPSSGSGRRTARSLGGDPGAWSFRGRRA